MQNMRARFLALTAILLFTGTAQGFDPSRCDNDADPVPAFASGRDADGCLLIDPGNGSAAIAFDWEANEQNELIPPSSPACTSNDCAIVSWDVNADDYAVPSTGTSGADAYHFAGRRYKYMLWKNFGAGNTFKCSGGTWTSPTGLQSCSGENSTGHVDAMQIRGQPVNDGWAVMQDSTIANANDIHMILEMNTPEYSGPAPGFVFQNVRVGYFPDWGEAENWTQDCIATGDGACGVPAGGSPRWQVGSNNTETSFKATWLINSWSHVRVEADRTLKLIVVNGATGGGCDNVNGCDGSIGFENGWPAPLGHAIQSQGPGVCPNGLLLEGDIRSAGGINPVPVYCYTSIEQALGDLACPDCPHALPPFIHLSSSGWENPPLPGLGGSGGAGAGGTGGGASGGAGVPGGGGAGGLTDAGSAGSGGVSTGGATSGGAAGASETGSSSDSSGGCRLARNDAGNVVWLLLACAGLSLALRRRP